MNRTGSRRNVAVFDKWHADDNHCQHSKPEELHFDVSYWPPPSEFKCYTLRLEELTHYEIQERINARIRNMKRIQCAQQRKDIVHLNMHYTCCIDQVQRDAVEALVQQDDREWCVFTMVGINGVGDFYSCPNATSEALFTLFMALQNFHVLNLHSSTWNRGHGLENILKAVPYFSKLKVLRLEGWQMDRVSVTTLMESLRFQHRKSVSCLSMRSCRFVGEGTFMHVVDGLQHVTNLKTMNVSYCNLDDSIIVPLANALQQHPSIINVHLGGNCCRSAESVQTIASWIRQPACQLLDLNLRSLWTGFSDEGLLQRFVDIAPIFDAISENQSIVRLSISENYLDNNDIAMLAHSLGTRPTENLRFLDVGDNPFGEKGARILLSLVQNLRSIQAIRFENHFMHYNCSELVKLLAEFNTFHPSLLDPTVNVSLALWPHALEKVQRKSDDEDDYHSTQHRAANHLFRLLRSATGQHGHELGVRIAIHNHSI
jgi:hypothetical protein